MQVSGIKKEIEQLRKAASSNNKQTLREDEFWEDINKEQISEGEHPVIFLYRDFKNVMINEIFYEPNLEKIDEFRISEGKFPLLPLYLADEYKKVKDELRKYEASFFWKTPGSTLLDKRLQPLADACSFENIDRYHEAKRLFMQDQNLYHLHTKPELGEDFIKYFISERETEGANQLSNNDSLVKVTTEQLIPDKIKKYLNPIESIADEYHLTSAIKEMKSFKFEDSVAVPGQTITLKYTQTGKYIDQGK